MTKPNEWIERNEAGSIRLSRASLCFARQKSGTRRGGGLADSAGQDTPAEDVDEARQCRFLPRHLYGAMRVTSAKSPRGSTRNRAFSKVGWDEVPAWWHYSSAVSRPFARARASRRSSLLRRCLISAGSSSRAISSVAHRSDAPMRLRK